MGWYYTRNQSDSACPGLEAGQLATTSALPACPLYVTGMVALAAHMVSPSTVWSPTFHVTGWCRELWVLAVPVRFMEVAFATGAPLVEIVLDRIAEMTASGTPDTLSFIKSDGVRQ